MKILFLKYLFLITLFIFFNSCENESVALTSPDKKVKLEIIIKEGKPYYQVKQEGKTMVDKSELGFTLHNNEPCKGVLFGNINYQFSKKGDECIWGTGNTYNQIVIGLEEKGDTKRKFDIVFRVFNNGYQFRYEFPIQNNLKEFIIADESTEFNLPKEYALADNPDTINNSFIFKTDGGAYYTISELEIDNYPAMRLTGKDETSVYKIDLTSKSKQKQLLLKAPGITPWRVVLFPDTMPE
ncbi:glycoside hydrolase family 97 N-terminal domain-containing protein [Prevotella sp. 10(H)]|uniref:glycoside hydrolase family 97 N-terminal domain-containing protein n=1 Tax=Prevotella sp. 10(H) TaxID=1158294 RepID=UPI0004A6F291|nr:glycoside hydrolase family 97 N-terminal domain-containing protein [Prevotella sp. 10(H)]